MVTVNFNETNLISPEVEQAKKLCNLELRNGGKEIECMLIFHQESLEQSPHPPPPGYCPRVWDYVLCWPPTPSATIAHIPCFPELNGIKYDTTKNATRLCHSNGTWDDYTDFSACAAFPAMESSLPKLLSPVEITTILYITGYTLSLVALSAAVFIFIYFKDLRCLRNTIHTNLMATYILSDTVWMLTHPIQMYQSNEGTLGQECTIAILTLNIILHYLYLTNFFWMFVEGLYLYMLVVKTFARQNLKLRGYATIGWGAPIIVMVIWIAVKSFFTSKVHSETRLEARLISAMMPQCTLLMPDLWIDWIYQGPMLFVLFLNIVFLSSIMWVLITKLRAATNAETQQYRKATKALLVLIPLLGMTYILFIDAPTEDHIASVYHNVRAVLLSTQGFLVALLYCFLNSEVQNTFRHHLAQWKEARDIGMGPRYSTSKEWSPGTQQESMRLFLTKYFQRKHQMSVSEATTMTLLGHSVRQGSNVEAGNTRSENIF